MPDDEVSVALSIANRETPGTRAPQTATFHNSDNARTGYLAGNGVNRRNSPTVDHGVVISN
ncbi:hypothetical protein [Woeseia oceani]|nr:hypothetical protein [Woeseia oceani]